MIRVDSRSCFVAAAIATGALAACSGSGTPSAPVVSRGAQSGGRTQTTFVVHWPSAQQAASKRRRDTLSPSTASITIAVNGGAPYVVNKPTLTGSPSSTSVSINAPIGTDSFTFLAYDTPGGTGNVLDQAQISQDIIANANNAVGVTLDGVCAALLSSIATASPYYQVHTISAPLSTGATLPLLSSLRLDGQFPETISITQVDADGNTIVNSAGPVPIALQESGSTSHVAITPLATTAGNSKFSVVPLVAEPDGFSTTITASSPNCGAGTKTFPNSFTLSTSAIIYVADSNVGVIAFDQDGTQLATISTIKNITGMTYVPSSSSLVTIEPKATATPGIAFQTISLTGSPIASGTLPVPAADGNPIGNIAFNAANGYFLVALREFTNSAGNTQYGTVLEYSLSGSNGSAVKPTGTTPFAISTSTPPPYDPDSFAVFPSGNVIVGDQGSSSYFFDQNGNYLNSGTEPYVGTLAIDTTRQDVLSLSSALEQGYSENVSGSTLTYVNSFSYPNAYTSYTASAYVANVDELYGFSSTGSFALPITANTSPAVNVLPPGAFSALSAPTEAVVVP